MADAKLTDLGQIGTPADTDVYYTVQGGTSYYVTRTDLLEVEDTPSDGSTTRPISSNWAYDHENAADPHSVYPLAAGTETISGDWTFSGGVEFSTATYGDIHFSASDGEIWFDTTDQDDGHKVLGWNNGLGKFCMSLGVKADAGVKYVTTGDGGSLFVLKGESQDGGFTLSAAETGTADAAVTFGNIVDIAPTGTSFSNDASFSTNIDLTGAFIEGVYALSGTEIDPENGTIQTKTLSTNTTFTYGAGFDAGMSVTIMLDVAGTYTVTWPTTNWEGGSAPTLTSNGSNEYDVIVITKIGTQYYGKHIGMFT